MDFCELDDPTGHIGKAQDVLEFVSQFFCIGGINEEVALSYTQRMGLSWILIACSETLRKAAEQTEEERKVSGAPSSLRFQQRT